MERKLKIPAIYKHFKHTEDGVPNNYMYCIMFTAYPSYKVHSIESEIDHIKYPSLKQKYRFEEV